MTNILQLFYDLIVIQAITLKFGCYTIGHVDDSGKGARVKHLPYYLLIFPETRVLLIFVQSHIGRAWNEYELTYQSAACY